MSGNYGWYFNSPPAPEPPTPEDMVRTTVAVINERLAVVYEHQMTMRPLPDTARDDD